VRDLGEVVNDPHMHARGSLQWIDHPEYGRIVVQNSPIRYEGVAPVRLEPSSPLGAQNREVFCERLGLSEEEFEDLSRAGVI
jgi:CoA:oxalate CoA-transferase